MLEELNIENLLLIESAQLQFKPGLNILTGETGAGKTMLTHALDLLLGGRARSGIVRPGAKEAYVEGIFTIPAQLHEHFSDLLAEGETELVIARRVTESGPTRALIQGRTVPVGQLARMAAPLLAFYGQHEHRKLTVAGSQVEILDSYCGKEQLQLREKYRHVYAERNKIQVQINDRSTNDQYREQELQRITFELEEIDTVSPTEAEEGQLRVRLSRLRNAQELRNAVYGAEGALSGNEQQQGFVSELARLGGELDRACELDETLAGVVQRWHAAQIELDDIGHELTSYVQSLVVDDAELTAVQERLAEFEGLVFKYGGSLAAVLDRAEKNRQRYEELTSEKSDLETLQTAFDRTEKQLIRFADQLHDTRAAVIDTFSRDIEKQLAKLAMDEADFTVELNLQNEPGLRGLDNVDFLIAANPGVPPAPLREIASGGELSRIMLALLSVTHDQGKEALVFDEIDAGIGGRTARAVGEQLYMLAQDRQIICITHLPQIAARAKQHFAIEKDMKCQPARTTVTTLSAEESLEELVRMLGGDAGDEAALQHARELQSP